jgi:hypothetical protein
MVRLIGYRLWRRISSHLRASSFISGGMTVELFVSKAAIQQRADQVWATEPKNQAVEGGHITLNNNISLDVTSSGIVTTVGGGYHVVVFHHQVLPTVDFTYTITDSLTFSPLLCSYQMNQHTFS